MLTGRGVGQDHRQLCTDATQDRRTVTLDRRAGRGRVEAFDAHGRRAEVDRCGVGGPDAEAERGGDHRKEHVVGGELAVGDGLLVEVVPPILGVHNAFGQPGGARRGVDEEGVVGARPVTARCCRRAGGSRVDRAGRRSHLRAPRREVCGSASAAACAADADRSASLTTRVGRAVRRICVTSRTPARAPSPRPPRRSVRSRPAAREWPRLSLCQQRHPVAGCHAERDQPIGEVGGGVVELGPGQPVVRRRRGRSRCRPVCPAWTRHCCATRRTAWCPTTSPRPGTARPRRS